MALPIPGNIAPQQQTTQDAPAIPNTAGAPPIPGAAAGTPPPPPQTSAVPPVNPAFSQGTPPIPPASAAGEEDAVVVVPNEPVAQQELPFDADVAPEQEAEVMAQPAPQTAPAGLPPAPVAGAAPPMTAEGAGRTDMAAHTGGGGVLGLLAESGFEGLEIGFGTFPSVRLQNDSFSLNDGTSLGNTFLCVMHGSRRKWLIKCEDTSTAEEFAYSYDRVTTTGGKPMDELLTIWRQKGYNNPVWKEYVDVTAQLVDHTTRELGQMVLLSIPKTSNSRLTGYFVTLRMGDGVDPNQVVTQVYPGQLVTSAKKPFHPWAFKKYAMVRDMVAR